MISIAMVKYLTVATIFDYEAESYYNCMINS
jgi:hypothetical protein